MKCDVCGKEVKEIKNLFDASPLMGFVCSQCKNRYVKAFKQFLMDDNIQCIYIPCDLKHKKVELLVGLFADTIENYLDVDDESKLMTQKFSTELIIVYPEEVNDKKENILVRQFMHGLQPRNVWKGDFLIVKEKGWEKLHE